MVIRWSPEKQTEGRKNPSVMHTKRNFYGAAEFASILTPRRLLPRGPDSPTQTHLLSEQPPLTGSSPARPDRHSSYFQSKRVACPVQKLTAPEGAGF